MRVGIGGTGVRVQVSALAIVVLGTIGTAPQHPAQVIDANVRMPGVRVVLADGTLGSLAAPEDPSWLTGHEISKAHHRGMPLTISVDSNADTPDSRLADGVCSDAAGRCTLRAAVEELNAAGSGKLTVALPGSAVIDLTGGPLVLNTNGDTSIEGPGADRLAIKGGGGQGLFYSIGRGNATLRGVTLENGRNAVQGGCLYIGAGSSFTLDSSVIQGCTASFGGGGISSSGALTVIRSTVRDNIGGHFGGGILISDQGHASILNSTISGNSASQGGGINNNCYCTMFITNSTVASNVASSAPFFDAQGGGLLAIGPLIMTNATISGNISDGTGGGIADWASFESFPETSELRNTLVAGNHAPDKPDIFSYYGILSKGHNLIGAATLSMNYMDTDLLGTVSSPVDAELLPLSENGGATKTMGLLRSSPARDAGDNCVLMPPARDGCMELPLTTDQRGFGFTRLSRLKVDIGAFEFRKLRDATRPL